MAGDLIRGHSVTAWWKASKVKIPVRFFRWEVQNDENLILL